MGRRSILARACLRVGDVACQLRSTLHDAAGSGEAMLGVYVLYGRGREYGFYGEKYD